MSEELLVLDAQDEDSALLALQESARELLAFTIGEDSYAFSLSHVREILKLRPVTPVPRAPRGVVGVITVRGTVTTVVDLRTLLRFKAQKPGRHARILLIDQGDEIVGVLVDRVLQVYRLDADELELATRVSGEMSEYVVGIGRPREKPRGRDGESPFLVLIDPTVLIRRSHGR